MLKNVFPVAACGAGSLFFGNYAYLYLSVSFIQMLKVQTRRRRPAAQNAKPE